MLEELLATSDDDAANELSASLHARLCFGKQTPHVNGALVHGSCGRTTCSSWVKRHPHTERPGFDSTLPEIGKVYQSTGPVLCLVIGPRLEGK